MNKFENSFLPTKIEKQNNKQENQDDIENQENRMQYLANKFVEIFNEKITKPNPIVGQPNLQDPEIMRIFINSSLQKLCEDSEIDDETAKNIDNIIKSSDCYHAANKEMPEEAKRYGIPTETYERHAAIVLYEELEKIFPEEAMNLIRRGITDIQS